MLFTSVYDNEIKLSILLNFANIKNIEIFNDKINKLICN